MVILGEQFPNFKANTTIGEIQFHNWLDKKWAVFFSHPSDYTPVCTTELAELVKLVPEFEKRNFKIIALSCDSVDSHNGWIDDIKAYAKCFSAGFPYPIIADEKRELAVQLGMIDPMEKDKNGLPLTARAVFIIDPEAKMRLSILYPATTGRNFREVLRVMDSLILTEKLPVATPVNWMPGDDVMVLPTLSKEKASNTFPIIKTNALPSGKEYLRFTNCDGVIP